MGNYTIFGGSEGRQARNLTTNVSKILDLTALFTNMGILKFKRQLTIAFFAVVNHLNGPLRKQNFTLKVKVCDLCLVDFDPFCVFLCFQVPCL